MLTSALQKISAIATPIMKIMSANPYFSNALCMLILGTVLACKTVLKQHLFVLCVTQINMTERKFGSTIHIECGQNNYLY